MTHIELVLQTLGMKIHARRGTRAWTLCPYHQRPSDPPSWATAFFIRLRGTRAGQFHCFTCKNNGGLVELVMRVRGCQEKAAHAIIRLAAESYEPPRRRVTIVERPAILGRKRFTMPKGVLYEPLAEWVTPARRYAERRGITQEEVDVFGLGYAVSGRLSGRIIIPWLGAGGVLAGYSARTFIGAEPKYQTPPRDTGEDRSVMVGEHLWPEAAFRRTVVVVEGALNGLAIRRVLPWALFGALGGSEIEPLHVVKLGTFKKVVLVTDPDAAGEKAAAALGGMLGRYTDLERVKLPPGKDAMDVWKKSPEKLRSYFKGPLRLAC